MPKLGVWCVSPEGEHTLHRFAANDVNLKLLSREKREKGTLPFYFFIVIIC